MTHTRFRFLNSVADGTGNAETHAFNMPKLMGSINRKGYDNVDNQGNAQLYTIGMRLVGAKCEAIASCAPNTYVTRRAVKAWHDARVMMYKRAGISMKSLGYGRTLRPYLDVNHENGTTVEIDSEVSATLGITPSYQGDEWTYSRAAVSVPIEAGDGTTNVQIRDLVDTYSFTLLDASVTEDVTADSPDESGSQFDQDSFVSVGMIAEWLGSFKKRPDAFAGDNESVSPDNALLQLRSQQAADKEEVLELAQDAQREKRPWDLDNSSGQYSSLVGAAWIQSVNDSQYVVFEAPCGLFNLSLQNTSGSTETLQVVFDVLSIEDM